MLLSGSVCHSSYKKNNEVSDLRKKPQNDQKVEQEPSVRVKDSKIDPLVRQSCLVMRECLRCGSKTFSNNISSA